MRTRDALSAAPRCILHRAELALATIDAIAIGMTEYSYWSGILASRDARSDDFATRK